MPNTMPIPCMEALISAILDRDWHQPPRTRSYEIISCICKQIQAEPKPYQWRGLRSSKTPKRCENGL
jgi:hypothetical protein